ncbi:MAG: HAD domain-containing protein [Gallionella sp.]|nr:HAD domain-containing protein [Gallionella sp.]MDD4947949.1 HAD domain-containing protein [Gallionella sp.]
MILCLDFDGVLHPHLRHEPDFCRLPLLWQILRACPNVNVVFSTSWREVYRHDELVEFVTYGGGEDLAHRIVGATPSLENEGSYGRRDMEILSWCEANGYKGQWIALDDIPEVFNGNPNLYVVDGSTGLTEAAVAAIIQRLCP